MKKTVDQITNIRTYVEQIGTETLTMIVKTVRCDMRRRSDLMNVWVKRGCLDAPIRERLDLECYYECEDGSIHGAIKTNPTVQVREDGRVVIDFAWMLPATEANEKKLIAEVVARAHNAYDRD